MDGLIPCPLCSQPGFSDIDTLRLTLISVSTRSLICPICQEVLLGLDKLTIHLVSHSLQACFAPNISPPCVTVAKENEVVGDAQNQFSVPLVEVLPANSCLRAPQYILLNLSPSQESQSGYRVVQGSFHSADKILTKAGNPVHHHNIDTKPEFPQKIIEQEASQSFQSVNITQSKMCRAGEQKISTSTLMKKEAAAQDEGMYLNLKSPLAYNVDSKCQTNESHENSSRNEIAGMFAHNRMDFSLGKQTSALEDDVGSGPLVSCGVCCLKFKDHSIAFQHQQLVHNHKVNQNISSEGRKVSADFEIPHSLKYRHKKNSGAKQMKDMGHTLHRFPCNQCSKVFRMRGSLMIHLRVAHSQTIHDIAEPISTSLSHGSDHKEMQEVMCITSNLPSTSQTLAGVSISNSTRSDENLPNLVQFIDQYSLNTIKSQQEKESRLTMKDADLHLATSPKNQPSASVSEDVLETEVAFHGCGSNPLNAKSPVESPTISPVWTPTSPCLSPFGTVTNTTSNVEDNYTCVTCNKVFVKESLFTQHMKSHEGKQWECDVCCKLFTTKYFLKKHKRLHTGEMPYTCGICNKSFTFQQSYHKHLLYHSDDKPHTCSECGRAFKELSTLHNHQRIHTGEKPWACETCGKCFRQRVSYLVHRRIHTGAMPYQCTACLKSFRYKVSQRTHKCTAQPPGDVVCQPNDLLQRLLLCSLRQSGLNTSVPPSSPNKVENIPPEEYTHTLKEQLQQLNIKQESTTIKQSPINSKDNSTKLTCEDKCHETVNKIYPVGNSHNPTHELRTNDKLHDGFTESSQLVSEPHENPPLWLVCENPALFELFSLGQNELPTQGSSFESDQTSPKTRESLGNPCCQSAQTPSQGQLPTTGDANGDLLQDILSIVMTPSVDHTPSSSQDPSEKYPWDADPEAELHNLFYDPFDPQQ